MNNKKISLILNSRRLRENRIIHCNLIYESARLLIEQIKDVEDRLKKSIDEKYIESIKKFKASLNQEADEMVSVSKSLRPTSELKDKLNSQQAKQLIQTFEKFDSLQKEFETKSKSFSTSLAISIKKIESQKELYYFLENKGKDSSFKSTYSDWSDLVRIRHTASKIIDENESVLPKELVDTYVELLESFVTSTDTFIRGFEFLKDKLVTAHQSYSVDDLESDDELKEKFINRVESAMGKKLDKSERSLVDMIMVIMKGDREEIESLRKVRKKLKDRDVEKKDAETGSFSRASTLDKTGF